MRCPNCGSSAQPKVVSTEYHEDGWDIEVVRHYVCGCGEKFIGLSCYHCDGYEIVESEKGVDKPLSPWYNRTIKRRSETWKSIPS